MTTAELELKIKPSALNNYGIEVRFTPPNGTRTSIISAATFIIDEQLLLALFPDPDAYGRALTKLLFTDTTLQEAWRSARSFAFSSSAILRINFRLDDTLNRFHWETVRDPDTDVPLALSEQVLFSRSLIDINSDPVIVPSQPNLKAVVAVSSPKDLATYRLSEIDVEGELSRVTRALGEIPALIIADYDQAIKQRVTLENIINTLRESPAILYLVAPLSFLDGQPFLWLENNEGLSDRISGISFAQAISSLNRKPSLIVLATYRSAGASSPNTLAAIGPMLTRSGVAATLGFQGDVTMQTVRQIMPTFFRELKRDGQVDRALAVARTQLRNNPEWWAPTLWMRVLDGRLWRVPEQPTVPAGGIMIGGNVGTVQQISISGAGGTVQGPIIGSQNTYGVPPVISESANKDIIAQQQSRLEAHRQTLAHYLSQLAITGSAYARPEVMVGIREARAQIKRIKTVLRSWSVTITDLPDDEA